MPYFEVLNDIIIKSPALNPYAAAKLRAIKLSLNANIVSSAGDKKLLIPVISALVDLSGQRPKPIKATESVAAFRVRKTMEVGAELTLRGKTLSAFVRRMRVFLPHIVGAGVGAPTTLTHHRRVGIKDLSAILGQIPTSFASQRQRLGGANLEFQFKGLG